MSNTPVTKNFWEKIELFTPQYVRLFAAHRIKGHAVEITDEEIAKRSGLSMEQIHRITWSKNWDNITIGEMKAYLHGCKADFTDPKTSGLMKKMFARGAAFRHCYRSPNRAFYAKLLKSYAGETDE